MWGPCSARKSCHSGAVRRREPPRARIAVAEVSGTSTRRPSGRLSSTTYSPAISPLSVTWACLLTVCMIRAEATPGWGWNARASQIPSPGRYSFVNGGKPAAFGLLLSRPREYIHCPKAAHCAGSW
jgi:hypothetical protein